MRTAGPEAYTIMAAEVCCRESARKRQAEAARPDLGGGRGGTLTGVCSCIDCSERIRRGGQRPGAICPGRPIEGCRPWLSRPRGGLHLAVWEWPEGSVVLLAPDRAQPCGGLQEGRHEELGCGSQMSADDLECLSLTEDRAGDAQRGAGCGLQQQGCKPCCCSDPAWAAPFYSRSATLGAATPWLY
ncbi:hypothetical protein NDU88_002220 [Pleurodeles waltl]|uniref:Uncharacterized protein n=1 Tax=Pleurodeles waltl TaxID=8319 RepID=A0AAV7NGH2_PLEWA|nr:hypothetical protein NDU88_002220 [Pleurodeles waltl]